MNEKNVNQDQVTNNESLIPEFYTNSIEVNTSPFEIEIRHQLLDSNNNTKGAINIRMSPQTAFVFAKSIASTMNDFQRQYGKINTPSID